MKVFLIISTVLSLTAGDLHRTATNHVRAPDTFGSIEECNLVVATRKQFIAEQVEKVRQNAERSLRQKTGDAYAHAGMDLRIDCLNSSTAAKLYSIF